MKGAKINCFTVILWTCKSEIFVQITNRIGGYDSNRFKFELNLELNQDAVVYVFNADCHNVQILLVSQTILHSYSASECVCCCYTNIK